jgi:lipid-A-disaccharide synthase
LLHQLYTLALERQPDVIICVDFSGFNRRFAHVVKQHVRARRDWFHDWNPQVIQYVSPQVWASRESRIFQIAKDFDLVLSIIPFEAAWYAQRVPKLPVEFVGHPIVDRHERPGTDGEARPVTAPGFPVMLLLPGSRPGELNRHLPVLIGALNKIRGTFPQLHARMVMPNETLLELARKLCSFENLEVQIGDLPLALHQADLAIASTGTVTLECAYYGVPTVALYKTSLLTWQIAKRILTVKYGAMPNLLANQEIFPEFIQGAATAENIAAAAIALLRDQPRRNKMKATLAEIVTSLGAPGASRRAAVAVLSTLSSPGSAERLAIVQHRSAD